MNKVKVNLESEKNPIEQATNAEDENDEEEEAEGGTPDSEGKIQIFRQQFKIIFCLQEINPLIVIFLDFIFYSYKKEEKEKKEKEIWGNK